jgi:uncharacterized protein YabE (DUF348 family)
LKARKILLITLAVLAFLGLSLGFGLRKTITLTIDGQPLTITTYAPTVGGLLQMYDIPLGELDIVEPPLNSWLQNYQNVNLMRAVPVQIWADNRMVSFTSPARLPSYLLAQAGLMLNPGDRLLSNGRYQPIDQPFPASTNSISLQINRAYNFSLADNGESYTYTSSAASLGLALWEAGITYIDADRLSPLSSSLLFPGMQASLQRARLITILSSSTELQCYTTASTVGGALAEARVALQGLDYSLPAPNEPIPADGLIRLVRVREEVLIEQTPLPFEIQYQPVADLEIDNQTINQTGEYGLTAQRVRILYEDNEEISRVIESEWVARQPQPRIIGYGTMIVMHTITIDDDTIQYWRAITMWATSYRPLETSNTTASGLPLQYGVAAVDIRYIPFYTRMYVPGYGYVTAADTGGGVTGRSIDLGYSNEDYVSWHSYVTVYFLWPPPDNVVYIFP